MKLLKKGISILYRSAACVYLSLIYVVNVVFFFLTTKPCSYYSADENIVSDETVGVVLEETEIVDADEPDDDNIQYHLYTVNRDDNAVAYKLMHVSNNDREGNEISPVIATPVNNTVQVLTSPLNGQLYVLSNGNDVVTSESARTVVPSVAKLQIEGSQNVVKKVNNLILLRHFILLLLFHLEK